MIKVFTVMYLLCALYVSDPDITQNTLAQNFTKEIIYQNSILSNDLYISQKTTITNNEPLDYVKELKNLNYYKEDSNDNKLNLRNAILRFQSDHNLVVDGEWNNQCIDSLKKRLEETTFNYPDSINESPAYGKWIVINKTKRILTLYENKTVLKKYPVAVGNPPSLTPSGKFSICTKVKNPTWGGGGYAKPVAGGSPRNPLGLRWLGISYKGGNRYGIHGNNSPYSIGKDISHGCIRMINSDVEELFEIVETETNLWLGTDAELENWGVTQSKYISEKEN